MMAFCNATKVSRMPLVVILGSTGTGKTKLSLQLAQKFGGEILSADSMQVYTDLDIITAKATKEERSLARHHLIDVVDPLKAFTVVDFRNNALRIIPSEGTTFYDDTRKLVPPDTHPGTKFTREIDDLLSRNTMPIVVGGTNYYIESLLWKVLVDEPGSMPGDVPLADCEPIAAKRPRLDEDDVPSQELHRRLQELDPEMAKRLHPNNRRKILRSLEVMKQRGRRHSDILREQQTSEGGSSLGGPLRYQDSLIFWLRCDQKILDDRLDARVDDMMKQGLVAELSAFHKRYNEQRLQDNMPPDYTKGIFQSIGFKEFHEYLILEDKERETEKGKQLLETGINNLKAVTRRYAKKQIRWVSNRFLGRPDRQIPSVYGLDTSDVSHWKENVEEPAIEIIESYLNNRNCKYKPLPQKPVSEATSPCSEDDTYFCDVCERIFVGSFQWIEHKQSKKHKKMAKKKNKTTVENSSNKNTQKLHEANVTKVTDETNDKFCTN